MTTASSYPELARQLTATGLVNDPWVDGAPRFRARPLVLARPELTALARAAESVAGVLDELGRIVADDPALLQSFFALTPAQALMWHASAPLWHGLARADVFLASDGAPIVCELNCDTPSGLAETVGLQQIGGGVTGGADPNLGLHGRFAGLLERFLARVRVRVGAGVTPTIGLVYPTELSDDLALVALYERWCEEAGFSVVLGSPYNLRALEDGGVAMFGRRCHLVLRHYKTDWWGERLPIWDDEAPYPDAAPLADPLKILLGAELDGEVAVINPFGAVLPQNKRAFAFCWESISRFSPDAQQAIRAFIPPTVRLDAADREVLRADRGGWVLKSDYGCEGEEVIVGREVTPEAWDESLARALPRRWIAQRYFESRRDEAGQVANHGVFLFGGEAAGVYARLSIGRTDHGAISVPTVVAP